MGREQWGLREVRSRHRFGVDESSEGLASFAGQQETFQVVPEALPLIAFAQHGIKVLGILFQGRWRLGYFDAVRHLFLSLLRLHSTTLFPVSTNYRYSDLRKG